MGLNSLNSQFASTIEKNMGYLAKAKKRLKQRENTNPVIPITEITLKEFSKRNLAIPVYSELLGEEIYFCSNKYMEKKVLANNSDKVCYTADELINLCQSNTSPEDIKKIHQSKKIFQGTLVEKTF